jgi:hypothetical protein
MCRLSKPSAENRFESLLLALACEGVKVGGVEFKKALETVLDKLGEQYD